MGKENPGEIIGKPSKYEVDFNLRRPGYCPVHGSIDFVMVKGTNAFVCPCPPESHYKGPRQHLVDRPPGRLPRREGH